jgi:hypothetical protein
MLPAKVIGPLLEDPAEQGDCEQDENDDDDDPDDGQFELLICFWLVAMKIGIN